MSLLFIYALISGILLGISRVITQGWILQLVALLPWLWGMAHITQETNWIAIGLSGSLLSIVHSVFLLSKIRLPEGNPILVWFAVFLSLVLMDGILWGICCAIIGSVWVVSAADFSIAALCTGALLALQQWALTIILPIWGSAPSWVMPWASNSIATRQFAIGGSTGLIFLLVWVQALIVASVLQPETINPAPFIGIITLTLLNHFAPWNRKIGTIHVAAFGWSHDEIFDLAFSNSDEGTGTMNPSYPYYKTAIAEAAEHGAQLIVFPETGLYMEGAQQTFYFKQFSDMAAKNTISIVVGWFDNKNNENNATIWGSDGKRLGTYKKTHTIPVLENYKAGSGLPTIVPLSDFKLGAMICHDDNFLDVAQRYMRLQTHILAIPTNDWDGVHHQHMQSSIARASECGYGLIRATSGGISAIVSAKGKILARKNHVDNGHGLIHADLPIYRGTNPSLWIVPCLPLLLSAIAVACLW